MAIIVYSKLTFEDHINCICEKTSVKLNALSIISHYMDSVKWWLLMNAFFTSQFNYCPLTWKFHRGILKINRLRERFLQLMYSDNAMAVESRRFFSNVFLLNLNFQRFSKFFPSPLHQTFHWYIKNMTKELHSI